ncbi:MAG: hypothetical protein IJ642_03935 [Oscillospiraceae bacterium]|nr:hypothetical protein [Oscillospiraceae bacterium]
MKAPRQSGTAPPDETGTLAIKEKFYRRFFSQHCKRSCGGSKKYKSEN